VTVPVRVWAERFWEKKRAARERRRVDNFMYELFFEVKQNLVKKEMAL